MVIQHIIDIDFVARDNTPVVHLTQYDDGLPYLVVRTFQNGNPLVLSSNEVTASLRFMKSDGNFVLSPGTVSDTEVCFKIPSAMTVFQGKYPGKVELKDSIGQIICSATIIFDIDMNPVQKDVVESDSDYKDYIDQVLGNIPGFDGYSKEEADAKFAPIDDVQKLEDRKLDKEEADTKFAPIGDVQKLENKKLDKVVSSGGGRAYCVNSAGDQVMRKYSGYQYNPGTLLYRESNGDCCMQDPVSDMSIANKRYVDRPRTVIDLSDQTETDVYLSSGRYFFWLNDSSTDKILHLPTITTQTDIELYLVASYGRSITLEQGLASLNSFGEKDIVTVMDEFNARAAETSDPQFLYLHIVALNPTNHDVGVTYSHAPFTENPVDPKDIASKQYVDSQITAALGDVSTALAAILGV